MIADPAVNVHYIPAEFHAKYVESKTAGATFYDLLL